MLEVFDNYQLKIKQRCLMATYEYNGLAIKRDTLEMYVSSGSTEFPLIAVFGSNKEKMNRKS